MKAIQLGILRYVADPIRNEPRNVGVIVSAAGAVKARFRGENVGGELDLRTVPQALIDDRQTYAEWVKYLRSLIDSGRVDDPVRFRHITAEEPEFLAGLAAVTRGNYQLWVGPEAYSPEDENLNDALADAYSRFVGGGGLVLDADRDEGELAEPPFERGSSHRQLAHDAYLTLRRGKLQERKDFVRHYKLLGKTQKGSAVPAVYDLAVVPQEQSLFSHGETLLVDAVSFYAADDDAPEVVDRARAVAQKAIETREQHSKVEIRVLVSNGRSTDSEVGTYALSVLHDEAELQTVTLPQLADLFNRFLLGGRGPEVFGQEEPS